MSFKRFLLGLGIVAGGAALLWPRRAAARVVDEDALAVALARLRAFIAAARIDAVASLATVGPSQLLHVLPGKAFVAEDAAALPRKVDGVIVMIDGWPR